MNDSIRIPVRWVKEVEVARGRNYVTSHIRTLVPVAVGFAITWIARTLDIVLDEETSAEVVSAYTSLAAAVYYLIVRAAAEKFPAAGKLLGVNKAPQY